MLPKLIVGTKIEAVTISPTVNVEVVIVNEELAVNLRRLLVPCVIDVTGIIVYCNVGDGGR